MFPGVLSPFFGQDSEELSKPRPEHAAVAALTAKAPTGS